MPTCTVCVCSKRNTMALKVNKEKYTAVFLLKCQKEATKERKVERDRYGMGEGEREMGGGGAIERVRKDETG